MNRLRVLLLAVVAFFSLAAFSVIFSQTVYADDACSLVGESDPLLCGHSGTDEEGELIARIGMVLNTVYLWIGIIAVIFIVVGGVKYMTSAGSIESIKSAKNTVMYAVIGLIITILAFAITSFIIGAVNGSTETHTPTSPGGNGAVRGISVVDSVLMTVGQSAKLKAHIVPDYATNKELTYTSSDESIATVDEDGEIKAKREGTTTITVSSPEGPTRDVQLTVQKPVQVQDIILNKKTLKLKTGKSAYVSARIVPTNAANKKLKWTSTKKKIATVTQSGKITAIAPGKTTVSVTANNAIVAQTPQSASAQLAAMGDGSSGSTSSGGTTDTSATSNTPIIAKVEVTVVNPGSSDGSDGSDSGDYETQGPTTDKKFSGRLKFTPATQKIVDANASKINCKTWKTILKKHKNSFNAVLKQEFGGIFAAHAGQKFTVKTAADFQAAAEYTYGLWTIWGPDYNNCYKGNWGNKSKSGCHVTKWVGKDAFYYPCSSLRVPILNGYSNADINTILKSSEKVRTNCNSGVDTLRKLFIPKAKGSAGKPSTTGGKKIYKAKDLQVGDIIPYSYGHVNIVGEVYKDYVITYDTASTFQKTHSQKRKNKRSGAGWGGWSYAVRPVQLDQSKTLKGLK